MPRPKARSLRRTQRLAPEPSTAVVPFEEDDEEELGDTPGLYETPPVTMTPIDGGPPITDNSRPKKGGKGAITVEARKAAFLEAFKLSGTISFAARIAGVHRSLHSSWLNGDPKFEQAFMRAKEDFVESLEQEAVRRARDGVKREVFYQGEVVGNMQEYSDSLLMFLMKANRAGKYRDNRTIEHTGPAGGAMKIEVVYTDEAVTDDETDDLS